MSTIISLFKGLKDLVVKYVKLAWAYIQNTPVTSTVNTVGQEHEVKLLHLRNPKNVSDLPAGWKPGWKLDVQGTAVVQTPDGKTHEGAIQSIDSPCFTLESANGLGLLEKGVHPLAGYDQWAFRTGNGTGPGGAMLVMVTHAPGSRKLLYGTIDEKRPMSLLEKNDGTLEVMTLRTPPGGFVDPQEDAAKTAQRETLEECGIPTKKPTFVGSIVPDRAFFVSRFHEDGRPADYAVAIYTIKVSPKKLVAQPDGSYTFPQIAIIPDGLKKAKTLQVVFRDKKQSSNTADGLAIAAISKTEDFYSR
jgi:ADP-ribose pyrophosphatase YjhB (NUDIX family)